MTKLCVCKEDGTTRAYTRTQARGATPELRRACPQQAGIGYCIQVRHSLALTRYCQYFIAIKGVVGKIYCAIL